MTKRAVSIVAVALSIYLPTLAQQAYRPELLSLNNSLLRVPSLALSDAGLFSFATAFNWMEATPPDFLPTLPAPGPPRTNVSTVPGKDSSKEVVDVRRNPLDYVHGEVGVLYGRSTGKFGREVEQGYIIGDVGDDRFHITVGAAYQNSEGRFPRFGR